MFAVLLICLSFKLLCHFRCGSCEAIIPTFARIVLDYDNVEDRLVLATANIATLGPQIQGSFPTELSVDLEKNGCNPLFALYRVR